MRAATRLTVLALLAVSLVTTTAIHGAIQTPPEPRLRLHRTTIDTATIDRANAAVLTAAAAGQYSIIQFRGPISTGTAPRYSRPASGFWNTCRTTPTSSAATLRNSRRPQRSRRSSGASVPNADKLAPALLRALRAATPQSASCGSSAGPAIAASSSATCAWWRSAPQRPPAPARCCGSLRCPRFAG